MSGRGGIASGVLVALVGVWLVLRTVTHNDDGQNLVDRLLGLDAGAAATASGTGVPPPANSPRQAIAAIAATGARRRHGHSAPSGVGGLTGPGF